MLVIDSLSKVTVLCRREFGVPIHLFTCDYLHEQNQSLEFTLVRVRENFKLHEVGLFHDKLKILLKGSKKEADSTALEIP